MKRKTIKWVICFVIVLMWGISCQKPASAKQSRKITLMIYMCGSNLESAQGSATKDLQEMLASGGGGDEAAILVQTGGTSHWANGLKSDEINIIEIRKGHQRTVLKKPLQNMGNGKCLADFLDYGFSKYPAEEYALIIWDHGGGPLEGVCWDELFSLSHLSFPNLVSAIRSTRLPQKLSWIGFDACLMSSLEVAVGLSPVADYMIASQETEPPFGWNYSFLGKLGQYSSAAETGKAIIDAYFEGQERSREPLTMSCTDLSKAEEAANTLGQYFSDAERQITSVTYPLFSKMRQKSIAFGENNRSSVNDSGYDLIDVRDLVAQTDWDDNRKHAILNLLECAVVYNRSNIEDANGLSIYHPFTNQKKYLSAWRDSYLHMDLIHGYTKYVMSFATILIGKQLIRWENLWTERTEAKGTDAYAFSVQLTEEQVNHFASGQLMIIANLAGEEKIDNGASIISVSRASLDEKGLLTGTYDQRAYYVVKEDGSLMGPLGFMQTEDGLFNVIQADYKRIDDLSSDNSDPVQFYYDASDQGKYPKPAFYKVWDEATETYSSRLQINEENYRHARFFGRSKTVPSAENGALPDYFYWKSSKSIIMYHIDLPTKWRIMHTTLDTSELRMYAMFRITDSQHNSWCTVPIEIPNKYRSPFSAKPFISQDGKYSMTLNGFVDNSSSRSIHMILNIKNYQNDILNGEISRVMLINDEREVFPVGDYDISVDSDSDFSIEYTITNRDILLLESLNSVSLQLIKADGGVDDIRMEINEIDLLGIGRSDVLSVEQGEQVDVKILNIKSYDTSGFSIRLLISNSREEEITLKDLIINDFELAGIEQNETLLTGRSRVFETIWTNGIDTRPVLYSVNRQPWSATSLLDFLLQQHGEEKICKIGVVYTTNDGPEEMWHLINCYLERRVAIANKGEPHKTPLIFAKFFPEESNMKTVSVPIANDGRFEASVDRIIYGRDQILLLLEIRNLTKGFIAVMSRDYYVNDGKYGSRFPQNCGRQDYNMIAPEGRLFTFLSFNGDEEIPKGSEISDLSILLYTHGDKTEKPASIAFSYPIQIDSDELTWLTPEQVKISPVIYATPPENPDADYHFLQKELVLPENAVQYLRWIEAPFTPAEVENAKRINMFIITSGKENTDTIALIYHQQMKDFNNGKRGCWFPGLIACNSESEQEYIFLDTEHVDEKSIRARMVSPLLLDDRSHPLGTWGKMYTDINVEVDYTDNYGYISNYVSDKGRIDINSDDVSFEYVTISYVFGEKNREQYPPFQQLEESDWGVGFSGRVKIPFSISLRPVTDEDDYCFLFSILFNDDTGYSIIKPYSEVYGWSLFGGHIDTIEFLS